MKKLIKSTLTAGLMLGVAFSAASSSAQETEPANVLGGRADTYKNLESNSLEHLSSPTKIESVARGALSNQNAPTELWRILEHGEKVECLSCVPVVAELLYHEHAKSREISAWWLRRRIFGVFGPGQVYAQTVDKLQDTGAPEHQRAYAAEALGEFLSPSGIKFVATSAIDDPSPMVRAASVNALRRLNNEGPNGEVAVAMGDDAEDVRMAALDAASRIHVFTGVDSVAERLGDESPRVRMRASLVLGQMRARDAVASLSALLRNDADPEVRKAAAAALGEIGDLDGRAALEEAQNDSDSLVRDAARIALRRI